MQSNPNAREWIETPLFINAIASHHAPQRLTTPCIRFYGDRPTRDTQSRYGDAMRGGGPTFGFRSLRPSRSIPLPLEWRVGLNKRAKRPSATSAKCCSRARYASNVLKPV